MTGQTRRIAGGGAAPILPKKSEASEPTTHGRTPDRKSPASEAAPDEIRTCYLRHGDRVGIGMTPLILMASETGAQLIADNGRSLAGVYASCEIGGSGMWTITRLAHHHGAASIGLCDHSLSVERFEREARAGRTALRLSPAGASWRLEIDADPAMPLMLNARVADEVAK